jgi:predicted transglutaminase-like cysteine proteinase
VPDPATAADGRAEHPGSGAGARSGGVTRRLALLMLGQALLVPAAPLCRHAAHAQDLALFGRQGKKFTNFRPIPHWPKLIERFKAEERRNANCPTGSTGGRPCPYTEWNTVIASLQGQARMDQVRAINRFANKWRYITDPINWGMQDYWATPGEFFAKAGDCEDYGIVKFMSLRALGLPNDDLRLVAVKDLNLGIGHAVTVVLQGGRWWLLDNQIEQVIDSATVRHYQPVYAANEEAWWLYR